MAETATRFRTPLARVRGLGAAKEGVNHWWVQRVTAILLVPLTLWFVASVIHLAGADYMATVAWLRSPVPVGLMILLIGATFHHLQLGVQVVIEDYIHIEAIKIALVLLVKIGSLVLALASILALLFIAFRSWPLG
jgi:succinate dehydrogenase / fumarate reductase membrane anchor subunit